jgi:hypothetical protein
MLVDFFAMCTDFGLFLYVEELKLERLQNLGARESAFICTVKVLRPTGCWLIRYVHSPFFSQRCQETSFSLRRKCQIVQEAFNYIDL